MYRFVAATEGAVLAKGKMNSEVEILPTKFETLAHSDPQFDSYLRGSFSSELVAIPIRTLNVGSLKEEVTFEVLEKKNIKRPSFFSILLKLLRPQTLSLSAGTMLVSIITASKLQLKISLESALLTIFSVLFFHASLNLFNDFYDHLRGHDRINPQGGSRVIQQAWLPAHIVQKIGFVFLGLSIAFGLPVLYLHSGIVVAIAAISAFAGLEFAIHKLGFKNFGLGEYLVFFLTGPLLTSGAVWAVSGQFQMQMLYLGFVFGSATLFFYHISNIENILVDALAARKTWAVYLGIDNSKKALWFIAGIFSLSYFLFVLSVCKLSTARGPQPLELDLNKFTLFLFLYFILALQFILICVRANRSQSPLSSELESLRNRSLRLHWLTVICMIIALI